MPKHHRSTPVSPAATSRDTGPGRLARWNAIAAVVALSASLMQPTDARALALGRVIVQSALGEPLRAEIEVPEITADEASSLRVRTASPETHRALGIDLSAVMASTRFSLERRPDGRAYLKVENQRPINEPFMDMVIEAQWAAGSLVRNYTMLFDPPNLRPVPAPLPPAASPAATPLETSVTTPSGASAASTSAQSPAPSAPAPTPAAVAKEVLVKPGDTASRIAQAHRPANVSLDQMLVAMLRANPKAFIGGNVNRVRAGVVLDMPDAEAASAVPAAEARQIIVSQSRDFNEFRRRLAAAAAPAAVTEADRQASGQVQTEVEERRPAAAAQDKLTLAKPESATDEAQIAQDRQSQDASARQSELEKNIQELSSVASEAAAVAAPAPASSSDGAAPATPPAEGQASTGAAVETTAPVATTEASPAETPAAPQPAPAPAAKKPAPPPPPVEEPSFFASLLDNPLVLPAAGALFALLAGFGWYRARQRKKTTPVDSSFLESRLQPDSFFGSSGGQRIDTTEASVSGSSMVYSPSQLDAAGDVDPVAEADVYLAYGRDLQAEEILKEAMRSAPTRVAIHGKLLEIYAKRRDARAFEVVATEAHALTQGLGPDWEHACSLGQELDPTNPLYQPGGKPAGAAGTGSAPSGGTHTRPFDASTLDPVNTPSDSRIDLDLDLDLGAPDPAPGAEATMSSLDDLGTTDALTQEQPASAGTASRSMDFDLEFLSAPTPLTESAPAPASAADTPTFDPGEDLSAFRVEDSLPILLEDTTPPPPAPTGDMLSFNLDDISLDLAPDAAPAAPAPAGEPAPSAGDDRGSPLETKLSLAEEFRAIGDIEGARSLAEEVLSEASGTLKTKASTFLADLS